MSDREGLVHAELACLHIYLRYDAAYESTLQAHIASYEERTFFFSLSASKSTRLCIYALYCRFVW